MSLFNIANLEIDLFAVAVLLIIGNPVRKGKYDSLSQKLFGFFLISVACLLSVEGLAWLFDGASFSGARSLIYILNYTYFLISLIPCFLLLLYCGSHGSEVFYNRFKYIGLVPTVIGIILLIFNHFNHFIFDLDENNCYIRGNAYFLHGLIPFSLLLLTLICNFHFVANAASYEKRKYNELTCFCLIPLLGLITQALFYGVNLAWPCLALTALLCYVYLQNSGSYTDPLTQTNNRERFNSYTADRFSKLSGMDNMYLIIANLDNLKNINRSFGRGEGDKALVLVAKVLKRSLSDYPNGFLARIGNNEFAIILNGVTEHEVKAYIEKLLISVENESRNEHTPYDFIISIGQSGISGTNKIDFAKLFAKANQAMNEQRRSRKRK